MPLYDFSCTEGHRFERVVPLARFEDQQACECGSDARRLICAPRVKSDYIDPCRGMDGKMHDSLSGLRATYRPDGNPQGERYTEIGDAELPNSAPQHFDRAERRDHIKAAISDVKNGRVPPIPQGPAI